MKLFKAFCSGKSILLSDSQKLSRYIYLCKTTPISYKAISQSVGYISILNAQFNYQQFNTQLFPEFIELISRDLKEISQQEYNFYLQTISNYIETSFVNNDFNQQLFDQVVDQILKQGTYIQKALFYFHYHGYFNVKITKKTHIKQLLSELSTAIPANTEEKVWKLAILIEQHIQDNKQPNVQIYEEIVQTLELFYVDLPNFENFSTKMLLFRLTSSIRINYLQKHSQIDNKILQCLVLIQKMCQTQLDQNLSLLNSYQLFTYMELLTQNDNLLLTVSWDLIQNEILQRDLQKVPIKDQIAFLIIMLHVQKLSKPLAQYLVESLYKNINYIEIGQYSKVFQILHLTETMVDCFDKFLTKLQIKVNPKLLSLKDVASIMFVLAQSNRMDKAILEKYLVGIGNRIKDIDTDCAYGILLSINAVRIQNPAIFQKITSLKFADDSNIPLQLQILQYYQQFDPKNNRTQKIQQNFLKFLQKEYRDDLMGMFLQILISFQPNNVITLIPELKEYVKRFQKENEDQEEEAKEINEILRIYYGIE